MKAEGFTLQRLDKNSSANLSRGYRGSLPDDSANGALLSKNSEFFFSFNSPVPARKIHSFKETEWTLNKHVNFFFALECVSVLTATSLSTDYVSGL